MAWVIVVTGQRQFPGEDGGIAMNTAWSLYLHQVPYAEVVAAFPPLFLIGARVAFLLFGPGWQALVLITAVFTGVTLLAHVALLRRLGLGLPIVLAIAAGTQAATTVTAGFWWYNQMTAVTAVLFATALLAVHRRPTDRVTVVALLVLTGLLALVKPNVALPLLLLGHATLLWRAVTRRAALGALVGGAFLALFALALAGIDIGDMLTRLGDSGGRATDPNSWIRFALTNQPVESSVSFLLLGPLVAALGVATTLVRLGHLRLNRSMAAGPLVAVVLTAAATTMAGLITNNDFNAVDLAVFVAVAATAVALVANASDESRGVAGVAVVLAGVTVLGFSVQGLEQAGDRDRIAAAGAGLYFEAAPLGEIPDLERFDGLRAGPRLMAVASELDQVVGELGRSDGGSVRLYFGPRLQWAYPVLDVEPTPGIPLYWEPYQASSSRSDAMVERFHRADFSAAVFLRGDYTFFPKRLTDLLATDFDAVDVGTQLTVFRRRGA